MRTPPASPRQPNAPAPAARMALMIDAQRLFGQSCVVVIEYRGERYQLRQTRNGRLILTK
ncbi:MAG: hemin uptake protein HemP [Thiobacillus sp.]|jgi:hemin uptake protein HemP